MKIIFIGLLMFAFVHVMPQYQTDKLSAFGWLIGDWQMNTSQGKLTECWKVIDDSTFQGTAILEKPDGSNTLLEKIDLVYRLNEMYYIPSVNNQQNGEPVKFKIISTSANDFVAVNYNHDYPKRISYHLIAKDTLHARIDNGKEVPQKFSDYYFIHQKK